MENFTAARILKETSAFVAVRALAAAAVTLIMLLVGAIGTIAALALLKAGLEIPAIIVFIVVFGGLFALLRFAKKYFLYMIKAAHIAAITELITTGSIPENVKGFKGVIAYGKEKITNNFGSANIAFVADALIAGAVKQIMKWLNKAQKLFSWIPGAEKILQFLNLVLSTALNYIDEAILSYIFYKKDEKGNAFKKACDGLSYYAQSWKGMLKGAFKVAAFIWILRAVVFILFYAIFLALGRVLVSSDAAYLFGVILAWVLLYGIEAVIVVPYSTCIMINDYHKAIAGQELKRDLHGTLCKVSGKFKSLFGKSEQPLPVEPAAIPEML